MTSNNGKNFSTEVKNKANLLKNKVKTSFKNRKQYQIFQSKQFLGIVLVALMVFLMVLSFVQIPGFSTINSYTFGMLFGYYSYFFYIGFIIYGLSQILQINIRFEKFIATKFNRKLYFSWLLYLLFAIGIALVVESIRQWVVNKSIFPADKAFSNFFGNWWEDFSNEYERVNNLNSNPALPGIQNQGIVISLFMALVTSWTGYIVSIIIGLLLIAYFVYYVFYGSIIKKIRYQILGKTNKREIVTKEEFEDYKTKIMDLSFEDTSSIVNKPNNEITAHITPKTSTISITNSDLMFPVDNPFNESNETNKQNFIESKTSELNLEKNNTKEFKLDVVNNQIQSDTNDNKTFDFELDIFKTSTDFVNFDDNGISMNATNVDLSSNTGSNNIDLNINEVKDVSHDDDSQYDSKTIVFQNDPTVEKTIQFANDLTNEVRHDDQSTLFATQPFEHEKTQTTLNNTSEISNDDRTDEITNEITAEIETNEAIYEDDYEPSNSNDQTTTEDVLFKNDEEE